ncbi:MAG: hypothetical protein Q9172_000255 [Xanthocarpia lactea]
MPLNPPNFTTTATFAPSLQLSESGLQRTLVQYRLPRSDERLSPSWAKAVTSKNELPAARDREYGQPAVDSSGSSPKFLAAHIDGLSGLLKALSKFPVLKEASSPAVTDIALSSLDRQSSGLLIVWYWPKCNISNLRNKTEETRSREVPSEPDRETCLSQRSSPHGTIFCSSPPPKNSVSVSGNKIPELSKRSLTITQTQIEQPGSDQRPILSPREAPVICPIFSRDVDGEEADV